MTTTRKTRQFGSLVSLLALCVATSPAFAATVSSTALPTGGTVVAGSATIAVSGNKETINQSTNSAIINWNSFDIGSDASVRINQPTSQSISLNRVTNSQSPSQILGSLSSNGTVALVNAQGILFGKNAHVNVGGLIATASDIANKDFMNGNYNFNLPGNPNASINNAGSIIVEKAGLALLVGPNVTNSGYIEANLGKVQLASGDTFSVDLYGDGLLNLQASDQLKKQLVENSGTIKANGGQVLMTAAAAEGIVNSLINMDGIVQADSVGTKQGKVVLYAEGSTSTVNVSGTIKARGKKAGTVGGSVEVVAANTNIQNGATIDASGANGGGTIKVGGDFHGAAGTPTATNTTIENGATLLANATQSGNGGNVAVWSNNDTTFAGTINANGATGGTGGYVETSGETLVVSGLVNVGVGGTWLLDPSTLTIDSVAAAAYDNTLNNGGDVIVNTSGAIAINSTISKTGGADSSLTFNAKGGDITLGNNVKITSSHDELNVVLNAKGNVILNNGSSITSNNGDVTLVGTNFINNAGSNALKVGTGRWLVYSTAPSGDTFGNLNSNNTAVWNTTYGTTITQSGNRYVFAYQPTVTITSINDSKTYGSTANVSSDYTVSGLSNGVANAFRADTNATAFSGTPSVTSAGSAASANAGTYTITVAAGSLSALDGYALAYSSNGKLTVNQAALLVTANSDQMTYGDTVPTLTASYFGFVNGDTAASLTAGAKVATGATSTSNVGFYSITASGVVDSNYKVTYIPGIMLITPATLTYTAAAATSTYGSNPTGLTGTVTGFVNGQNQASATTGTLQFSTFANHNSNVGTYAVDGHGLTADHGNYIFVQASSNKTALTINPATLMYVANAAHSTYGDSVAAVDGTVTGFVNGQTLASATKGTLGFTTTATSTSNAGSYAITGSGLTANHGNYVFVQATGNATAYTINPAALTVTADAQTKVYGSVDPTLTYSAGGFVNGDSASAVLTGDLTRTAGEHVANGPYAITQGSLTSNSNYTITYVGNSLTITPYTLSVVADNQARILDSANPPLTYTFGTLQNGDTSSVFTGALTTTAVFNSLPNNYPITQGTLSAGTDYTVAYTPGTLTVLSPLNNANEALLRQAAGGGGKHIQGTLLAIQSNNPATVPTGNLANLAPAAGGPNSLADLSPSAGGPGSVTALVSCNDATPCDINQ